MSSATTIRGASAEAFIAALRRQVLPGERAADQGERLVYAVERDERTHARPLLLAQQDVVKAGLNQALSSGNTAAWRLPIS